MGQSATRRKRFEEEQAKRVAREAAASPQPAPQAAPAPPKAVQEPFEEINFMLPPGGMMGGTLYPKPKTVKVDGPLNAHILMFQARHQGRQHKFQNATKGLWRALLREEDAMMQEAKALQHRTGVPSLPRKGPLLRALERELEQMRAEESGDIFDDE